MNKQEWKNFKLHNTKHIYKTACESWVDSMFETPVMDFFAKFKKGKKWINNYFALRFLIKKKPIIPIIEYMVTTKCTMNCKNCNSFMPYFSNESHTKPDSFEVFKSDIDKLLNSVDYIYAFGFVGGEPLIDNELAEKMEYVLGKKQIKNVFLATNCTILPTKKLLKVMKNKKFKAQISNYSHVKNIKNGVTVKHDEFKDLLLRNNILLSDPHGDDGVFQSMPKLYKDIQNPDKVKLMHDNCWGLFCNMLCEGEITPCTLSVYINRNLELSDGIKEEIVNIRTAKNSKDLTNKIIKYYARPYSQFCHYCHNDDIQYGFRCGEQIET